jgi:LTXXQ motif family protein
MKLKFVLITFLLAIVVPATLLATTNPGTGELPSIQIETLTSEANNTTITDVLSTASALPRGPREILEDYQAEMVGITQSFSARVAAIAQAVQNGQLSSEQGQKLSTEQYQMAQMQFDLLSAWREMIEHDLARTPSAKSELETAKVGEIATVALPFSSLELNASLAEYLDLTPSQSKEIRQLMTNEHRNLQPLMAQLRVTREKLLAASGSGANEKEVKALAAAQANMLAKLIVSNSRMQAKLYKLLDRDQQKKLDDFKRTSEPMIASK